MKSNIRGVAVSCVVIFLISISVLLTYNMIVYNKFTFLGNAIFFISICLSVAFCGIGFWKNSMNSFLVAVIFSAACVLLAILMQAKDPAPQKGVLVDSTEAWEKFARER